eukprot:jgi/Botrbrau1/6097/Bobra.177_1s0034.1
MHRRPTCMAMHAHVMTHTASGLLNSCLVNELFGWNVSLFIGLLNLRLFSQSSEMDIRSKCKFENLLEDPLSTTRMSMRRSVPSLRQDVSWSVKYIRVCVCVCMCLCLRA